MRWFGESWGAPACEEAEHVEVPVGEECLGCRGKIVEGDRGVMIPLYAEVVRDRAWHLACFVKSIFGDREVPVRGSR